ncbi:D-isomer-specific 2-hydroxyacid dehydrogenase-like protein [Xylariales sp. PMI_506]|nr:D-isomer-specific 2-hydroxyacid dehydrogenase-like protein [Xylariales sp. PMI_506]
MASNDSKPIVLHIGDPIKYNPELYEELQKHCTVIRPSLEERQRDAFLEALRTKKWGDFTAVMRPFWNTGGEMGRWDAELIPLLPKSMKLYAAAGAGFDWADVDLLAEAGIYYCNSAKASSEAVSDMAIYHIISVFRNMQWSNMAARTGDREKFLEAHRNAPIGAYNPQNRVLGVVGLGNIGYLIAKKAHLAFGMKILYNDLFSKTPEQEAAIGGAERCLELDDLLARSDCVVIATPGAGGKKLLDAARIAKMKAGSRLVNIARGSLIDETALADALESGHLTAVGLDVHENEPDVNPRLIACRNATLTCHTAGGAMETNYGFEELPMRNVMAIINGEELLTPVNTHLMK